METAAPIPPPNVAPHRYELDDYRSATPRWCTGCGDNGILAAMQRLCRDEQLPPERTVFVSGIGCASRFPHYMGTYGFHGLHGRALPIAQGIRIKRPDLHVFVNTGDGDCCSIGTAHWIHAIRYNMNLTVLLHDNEIYGLTKMQTSPTSPRGTRSNTTPRGSVLEPLDPLSVTLGVANVSFVAQAADWAPDLLYDVVRQAFHHRGLSFVRVLQRCPNYLPHLFDDAMRDPARLLVLEDGRGIPPGAAARAGYPVHLRHAADDLERARALAARRDVFPIGVLYRDETVPCYEDLCAAPAVGIEAIAAVLERQLDRFAVRARPAAVGG